MSNDKPVGPGKLCPFSMSLALPVKKPMTVFKGSPEVFVKVGGPCAGPKCMWWSAVAEDCVMFEILDELRRFNRPEMKN